MKNQTKETPAAALTPVPAGPFIVAETGAFGLGYWQTAVRGADGKRLCTIVEREFMPKESGAVRASFIAAGLNARAAAASRLRALRVDDRTALAWQKIPRYIRDELEAIEGSLIAAAKGGTR